MLNLLRLQAELQDLEHQLQEIRDEDAFAKCKDPIRASYALDFRLMRDWRNDGDSLQYDLLLSIGEKLREYSIIILIPNILFLDVTGADAAQIPLYWRPPEWACLRLQILGSLSSFENG